MIFRKSLDVVDRYFSVNPIISSKVLVRAGGLCITSGDFSRCAVSTEKYWDVYWPDLYTLGDSIEYNGTARTRAQLSQRT